MPILVALATALHLSACTSESDQDRRPALERARSDLVAAIDLHPLPNENTVVVEAIKSKDAPEYLLATGLLRKDLADAISHILISVERVDFRIVEANQPAAETIATTRDDVVAEVSVYSSLGVLQPPPGSTFVQIQIAKSDPRLAFTQIDP